MSTGTARCGEVVEDLLISRVQCKVSGVGHRRLHASPMSRRPSGPGQGEFLQDITPASVPNPRANPTAYVGGTLSRRGATLEERRSPGTPRGKSGNRDVLRPEPPGISPRCTELADPLVTSVCRGPAVHSSVRREPGNGRWGYGFRRTGEYGDKMNPYPST